MSRIQQVVGLVAIATLGVIGCAESEEAPSDAGGSDSAMKPIPECYAEGIGDPKPDERCGTVPDEYRYGCGCTDGVPSAACINGKWTCPVDLPPRTRCDYCSGPPQQL